MFESSAGSAGKRFVDGISIIKKIYSLVLPSQKLALFIQSDYEHLTLHLNPREYLTLHLNPDGV